jgi:hypothetical protein
MDKRPNPFSIPLRPWRDTEPWTGVEDGEEWKPRPSLEAAKTLYEQWRQVYSLIQAALPIEDIDEEPGNPEASFIQHSMALIWEDVHVVAIKIQSAEVMDMYVPRMENAAIIRKAAQSVASALLTFSAAEGADELHIELIRTEIDSFRELFKAWLATFQRDDYEDEWGVFV